VPFPARTSRNLRFADLVPTDDAGVLHCDLDLDGEVGMSDVLLLIRKLVHSVPFEL